ncbi:MAG: tyrosine-protein phosphatase [Saprospiraceae bacterium]
MNFNVSLFLVLAILIIGLSACSRNAIPNPAYTLKEDVVVERTKKADYKLHFAESKKWKIVMAEDPNTIDWDKPTATFDGDYIAFPKAGLEGRKFFGITSEDGSDRYLVTERIVPMKGAINFRDLGGLPAGENRIVRWGRIFRSDKLSDLTKKDLKYMSDLDIKAVCDFRNDIEVEKDRDRLPEGVKYYQFAIADKEGKEHKRIKKEVLSKRLKGKAAKEYFGYIMTAFADSVATDFKPVIELLLNEEEKDVPLLYHCTGGKDRTGLMSIVILSALGVEKEVVKNEYLMSNFYRFEENKKKSRRARLVGIDTETSSYAFAVQEEYFDRVFDVIENKYGGMDNYLELKFNLNEERRNELKKKYTMEIPPPTVAEEKKKGLKILNKIKEKINKKEDSDTEEEQLFEEPNKG